MMNPTIQPVLSAPDYMQRTLPQIEPTAAINLKLCTLLPRFSDTQLVENDLKFKLTRHLSLWHPSNNFTTGPIENNNRSRDNSIPEMNYPNSSQNPSPILTNNTYSTQNSNDISSANTPPSNVQLPTIWSTVPRRIPLEPTTLSKVGSMSSLMLPNPNVNTNLQPTGTSPTPQYYSDSGVIPTEMGYYYPSEDGSKKHRISKRQRAIMVKDLKKRKHEEELEKRRKYICKVCSKGFTTSGHLARHNRIHTGEKKHHCSYPGCYLKFSRHDNCVQHYRTHFKVREPYYYGRPE